MSVLLRFGQSVRRYEDARLLTGQGVFVDDLDDGGAYRLCVLRSPHASARIVAVDVSAALRAEGVRAVIVAEDLASLGVFSSRVRRDGVNGQPMFEPPRSLLASGRVRYVGEAVAAVVADSLQAARDAIELIEVTYAPDRAVPTIEAALAPAAPAVWPQVPDNVAFIYRAGDPDGAEDALASARHVVEAQFRINRVCANPIEPRAALGSWDASRGRFTLHVTTQTPHSLRAEFCDRIFAIPHEKLRVVAPDVGGGFGVKSSDYAEYGLVLHCAKLLGHPVRWTSDRNEAFLADHHARDNIWSVRLGFGEDLELVAAFARSRANLGAYLAYAGTHQATNNIGSFAGVYAVPRIGVEVLGVYTHSGSVSPYRGAGRPEALYAMERAMDIAALQLRVDRIELRRRNIVPASRMPWRTGLVFTYDSGDFPAVMERVLQIAAWDQFERRRQEAAARGRLRGIGFAYAIEIAGGPVEQPFEEYAEVRIDAAARVVLLLGTHSHGQGHETAFRQIASEALGIPAESLEVVCGDTDRVAHGRGTFGSRSMSSGGASLTVAIDRVMVKAKAAAAHLLEVASADIELREGHFVVAGTDRIVTWSQVAAQAGGFAEASMGRARGATFPNSAHVCEVEIDPETGALAVAGYWIVDDVGRVINPLLLYGQIQGGIAQGLGQVLGEDLQYDPHGQLLTASFMDYAMPRAADIPGALIESRPVPTAMNPLGVKGAGEAGTVGALPAAMNAIVDALRPLGVSHIDMPATGQRLWRTIHQATRGV